MKTKTLFAGLLAVATLGLASIPANATVNYAGQNTFLGSFVPFPGTPNSESFGRDQNDGFPVGAFDDFWFFNVTAAFGEFSANFVPGSGITGFTGSIHQASGYVCGAAGTTCTAGPGATINLTPIVTDVIPGIAAPGISTLLPTGQYLFRLRGTNVSPQTSYTGQIAFRVPEPGSLALLGMGLIGLGLARRRRA